MSPLLYVGTSIISSVIPSLTLNPFTLHINFLKLFFSFDEHKEDGKEIIPFMFCPSLWTEINRISSGYQRAILTKRGVDSICYTASA